MTPPAPARDRTTRLHDLCAGLLTAAIVPDPFSRRRRTSAFPGYVRHQQRADAVMRRLAPALSVATMASRAAAAAAVVRADPRQAAWRAASVLAVAGAVVLTVRVHVPINQQLRSWSPDAEPAGWRPLRRRWESAHRVRRALVVVAAAGVAVASR